jgi:serine/threonine protein kinase
MGYSYRDISFGNLFFDPDTGDVLICDNDNVSANGVNNSSVYGTPRFMAPEIVVGKAKPSRNTDLFSLAVLLFYMFMLGHPLEGKLEADIKCMDIHAMNKLYGTNPIFVFDPSNKTNRPVRGYQDNVLIYWDLYPQALRDLFIQSFTTGLPEPNKRVTEKRWMDAFSNLITGIVQCSCGAEVFYDEAKSFIGVAHTCWNCGKSVNIPASLVVGKSRILLQKDAKLYAHHITGNYDMNTVVGTVVQNPKNPILWGIRNESNANWTYIKPDGQQIPVASGRSAAVAKDVKIDFGQDIGYFC